MKSKAIKADEWDVISRFWRRMILWRPGETAAIKRRMRRRARHDAKHDLHQDADGHL